MGNILMRIAVMITMINIFILGLAIGYFIGQLVGINKSFNKMKELNK